VPQLLELELELELERAGPQVVWVAWRVQPQDVGQLAQQRRAVEVPGCLKGLGLVSQ
jgi:hypothetical protein